MEISARIRILCVDDHPMFREGIGAVIASQRDMDLVGMASNGNEAMEQFRKLTPNVTLMDLRLPDMSGIEATSSIRAEFPGANVLILTTFEGDVEIQRALAAGARGYMLKSTPPQELIKAIRDVHAGRRHVPAAVAQSLAEQFGRELLSEREIQVLRHLAEGCRNKDIGQTLRIAEETVKAHVARILEKLGARDRTQAVAIAIRRGIIHL
jgi:DNA-binding NarL/FixJ family response regulator